MRAIKPDTDTSGAPVENASGDAASKHAGSFSYGSGSRYTQEIRAMDKTPERDLLPGSNAWTWTVREPAPSGANESFRRLLDHAGATGSQPDDGEVEENAEPAPRF